MKLKIGTRASKLALSQVQEFCGFLPDVNYEIMEITTSGDKIKNQHLYDIGGKGLFTKEVEEALLAKEADVAIHSLKDVPSIIPEGLVINWVLPRERAEDIFLSPLAKNIQDMPKNARIGTCSPRRMAQILAIRPDLQVVIFRGNVTTRIAKLEAGEVDGIILAVAGLKRLAIEVDEEAIIHKDQMLPAIGQGVIAIQARIEDENIHKLLDQINHHQSFVEITAERAFLQEMEGSCRSPVAGNATLNDDILTLTGLFATMDGKNIYKSSISGVKDQAKAMGVSLAREIKNQLL